MNWKAAIATLLVAIVICEVESFIDWMPFNPISPRGSFGFRSGRNNVPSKRALTPQQLANCKADIAFLLDGSGSVKPENWKLMLDFVNSFAKKLTIGPNNNQFGVVDFGNEGEVQIVFSDYTDVTSFTQAVEKITFKDQNTNTADGLRKLTSIFRPELGDRADVANIAIILTDGVATVEKENTLKEANILRQTGANVFGIGIGAELDISELRKIIANDNQVFKVDDFQQLLRDMELVLGSACQSITTPLPPTTTMTPSPFDPCHARDIALVLDASGSLKDGHWETVKETAKEFVQRLYIGPIYSQISIITYSTESFIQLRFGEAATVQDVLNRIDSLEFIGQRTNVSGAIRTLYTDIFVEGFDRESADNVAVVITDTESNQEDDQLALSTQTAKAFYGITVFVVALGEQVKMESVSLVASLPLYHHLIFAQSHPGLFQLYDHIFSEVCAEVYHRQDTQIYPQNMEGDVVLVMDTSEALTERDFNRQMSVVQHMVENINFPNVRWSVVAFGRSGGRTLIRFNEYSSASGLQDRLRQIRWSDNRDRDVNIELGMDTVIQAFSANNGARKNMWKLLLSIGMSYQWTGTQNLKNKMDEVESAVPDLLKMHIPIYKPGMTAEEGSALPQYEFLATYPHKFFLVGIESWEALQRAKDMAAALVASALGKTAFKCDFEKYEKFGQTILNEPDTCGLRQDPDDDFDWLVVKDTTPSLETGPSKALNGSHFAYIEASGKAKNQHAVLLAKEVVDTRVKGTGCLSFFANLHGWHVGRLEVFIRSDDISIKSREGDIVLFSIYGNRGDNWLPILVNLPKRPDLYHFGFRAIRGEEFSGDIALDLIQLWYGPCPMHYMYGPHYLAEY